MNYYDYRSYFQQITSDLDSIQSNQETQRSELRAEVDEINNKFDTLSGKVESAGLLVTVFITIACVMKVMFR